MFRGGAPERVEVENMSPARDKVRGLSPPTVMPIIVRTTNSCG